MSGLTEELSQYRRAMSALLPPNPRQEDDILASLAAFDAVHAAQAKPLGKPGGGWSWAWGRIGPRGWGLGGAVLASALLVVVMTPPEGPGLPNLPAAPPELRLALPRAPTAPDLGPLDLDQRDLDQRELGQREFGQAEFGERAFGERDLGQRDLAQSAPAPSGSGLEGRDRQSRDQQNGDQQNRVASGWGQTDPAASAARSEGAQPAGIVAPEAAASVMAAYPGALPQYFTLPWTRGRVLALLAPADLADLARRGGELLLRHEDRALALVPPPSMASGGRSGDESYHRFAVSLAGLMLLRAGQTTGPDWPQARLVSEARQAALGHPHRLAALEAVIGPP